MVIKSKKNKHLEHSEKSKTVTLRSIGDVSIQSGEFQEPPFQ
jgi:hypothetical protein